MIQGIYTPNRVPFRADGTINEDALRRMVNWLIEKGVSGLYPNGSTGKFIRLSFEERKRVIPIVAQENHGRVPILAGAAETNLGLIPDACRTDADLGCAAVSVTGPYYYKVSQESIEHFCRELARQSPIDIVLYNALQMGADSGTIASSGVVPEVIMKLYHEFQAGNLVEAKRIQFKLLDLINAMLYGTNFPEGFRAGMSLRGFHLGTTRQLLSPREQSDLEEIRGKIACILADCGFGEAACACRRLGQPVRDPRPARSALDVADLVKEVLARLESATPRTPR